MIPVFTNPFEGKEDVVTRQVLLRTQVTAAPDDIDAAVAAVAAGLNELLHRVGVPLVPGQRRVDGFELASVE